MTVAQRPARWRQLGVPRPCGPWVSGVVSSGRSSGVSRPERDLDVGPAGELEDRPRVDGDLAASMLPETQVTATRSASGDAAA